MHVLIVSIDGVVQRAFNQNLYEMAAILGRTLPIGQGLDFLRGSAGDSSDERLSWTLAIERAFRGRQPHSGCSDAERRKSNIATCAVRPERDDAGDARDREVSMSPTKFLKAKTGARRPMR
jgi:hypothetical protein